MIYDVVFVTHLPSFYKRNLYKELSKDLSVAVIYLGAGSVIRNSDFVNSGSQALGYDEYFISEGSFEKRNKFRSLIRLVLVLRSIELRYIVVGGWEQIEFWLSVLMAGKHKSAIALESTIYETNLSVILYFAKRLFVKLVSNAFVSGKPHAVLISALGFRGNIHITGGVGMANRPAPDLEAIVDRRFNGRLLFVGRLSPEKNIDFLIDCVNRDPRLYLSVIGEGPMGPELKRKSSARINFLGAVTNSELAGYFRDAGALVLPSLKEPWGLVVEEAAYHRCPCIVSDSVGCSLDFVARERVGLIYESHSSTSFKSAINALFDEQIYSCLAASCRPRLFTKRSLEQLHTYINVIDKKVTTIS